MNEHRDLFYQSKSKRSIILILCMVIILSKATWFGNNYTIKDILLQKVCVHTVC